MILLTRRALRAGVVTGHIIMNDLAQHSPDPTLTTTTADVDPPVARVAWWQASRLAQRQRLSRIRRSVLRGEYENELKISVAADRILDALFPASSGDSSRGR